jgi:hypothetical protein
MRLRSCVSLLFLYVALDFANPLMPGAVNFSGGSVDMVDGDLARTHIADMAAVLAPGPDALTDRPAPVQVSRRPAPVGARRDAPGRRPAPRSSPSDLPESAEDH